jgi:hypothetical protein
VPLLGTGYAGAWTLQLLRISEVFLHGSLGSQWVVACRPIPIPAGQILAPGRRLTESIQKLEALKGTCFSPSDKCRF